MSIDKELETVLGELEDSGVEADVTDRIKGLFSASPIRKERDDYKERATKFEDDSKKYRGLILKEAFDKRSIKIAPEHLKLPENLDPTNDQEFDTWAVAAGLVEAPQTPELDAMKRIEDAGKGGESTQVGVLTPEEVATWPVEELLRLGKQFPAEYEALKRGEQVQLSGFNRIVRPQE